jgi:hypothetical protein
MDTCDAVAEYIRDLYLAVEAECFDLLTGKGLVRLIGSPVALHIALGAYRAHFAAVSRDVALWRGKALGGLCSECSGRCALGDIERECCGLRQKVDLSGLLAVSGEAYLAGARRLAAAQIWSASAAVVAQRSARKCAVSRPDRKSPPAEATT